MFALIAILIVAIICWTVLIYQRRDHRYLKQHERSRWQRQERRRHIKAAEKDAA